jgi:hypothetical protein
VALAAAIAPAARADSACSTAGCGPDTCGSSWDGFETLVAAPDYPDHPLGADTPVAFVDPADGSSRRLIATKQGVIWVWDGATRQISPLPFLDLGARVLSTPGERGLLALAVDPDYAETGELYVLYTGGGDAPGADGDLVIERYARSAVDPAVGDPASAARILVVPHPDQNHNGGWLAFGSDGMLLVSLGDGGGSCDDDMDEQPRPPNGQNLETLLAKLLRLDVRGADPAATPPECDAEGGYGVPLGNPFAGETAGCGEIWAYGLRNPFRFSVDRATGDLWLGDVGQGAWEEIDYLPADYYPLAPDGAVNFGWKCREGCETLTCPATDCPGFHELLGPGALPPQRRRRRGPALAGGDRRLPLPGWPDPGARRRLPLLRRLLRPALADDVDPGRRPRRDDVRVPARLPRSELPLLVRRGPAGRALPPARRRHHPVPARRSGLRLGGLGRAVRGRLRERRPLVLGAGLPVAMTARGGPERRRAGARRPRPAERRRRPD